MSNAGQASAAERALGGLEAVARLRRALAAAGAREAWLVGGAVRDAALGAAGAPEDFDVALPGGEETVAAAVAREFGGSAFLLDAEEGAWRVACPDGATVDVVRFRADGLEGDLAGRDFTVNAVAFDLGGNAGIVDPLGGLDDLARRRLRLCGPRSLGDDPLRVLRAYRFHATHGFSIPPKLRRELAVAAPRLAGVSAERVRDELFRLLGGPHGARALRRLAADGVLFALHPEVAAWAGLGQGGYHSHDLLEHSLRTVEHAERLAARPPGLPGGERLAAHLASRHEAGVTRLALLKWTAFFHDVAKPETKSEEASGRVRFIGHDTAGGVRARRMLAALRVGKKTARAAERLVEGHMRLFGLAHQERPTARARLRYLKNFGDETPEALLLSLADEKATGPRPPSLRRLRAAAAELLALYWESLEAPPPEPLLRGLDLREELGLAEGKKIGEILRAVGEAEGDGRVSTRGEALEMARKLAQE